MNMKVHPNLFLKILNIPKSLLLPGNVQVHQMFHDVLSTYFSEINMQDIFHQKMTNCTRHSKTLSLKLKQLKSSLITKQDYRRTAFLTTVLIECFGNVESSRSFSIDI